MFESSFVLGLWVLVDFNICIKRRWSHCFLDCLWNFYSTAHIVCAFSCVSVPLKNHGHHWPDHNYNASLWLFFIALRESCSWRPMTGGWRNEEWNVLQSQFPHHKRNFSSLQHFAVSFHASIKRDNFIKTLELRRKRTEKVFSPERLWCQLSS